MSNDFICVLSLIDITYDIIILEITFCVSHTVRASERLTYCQGDFARELEFHYFNMRLLKHSLAITSLIN